MTLKTMEVCSQPAVNTIYFEFDLSYKSVTDLIAFIKIIARKFSGEIVNPHRFRGEPGKAFGTIQVSFSDRVKFCDADKHCQTYLTSAGRVKPSYVDALDYMDRGRFQSAKLLETINNSNFSN